jgi:polysaccharide biosynthesis/export protein
MRIFILLAASFLLLLTSGCQNPGKGPAYSPPGGSPSGVHLQSTNRIDPTLLKPSEHLFTLGPGDSVEIELLGDLDSRTTTTVGPDGKLYFNLLPGVDVWGLTLSQAKEVLEKEFAKFVKTQPQVSITLREVASQRVWLLGRFKTPGVYSMTNATTLLDAILQAGGPANLAGEKEISVANNTDELADLRRSFVIRNGKMLPVDFHRLLTQGDLSQNIYLQPDDFVYMPPATARQIYVLGAVNQPRVVAYSEGMTLLSAVANALGTAKYAYLSHVAIVRGSLTDPTISIVDYKDIITGRAPDFALQPRDIVYVPLKPYRLLSRYADLIMTTFASSVAINEGSRAVLKDPPPTQGILIPFGSQITVSPGAAPAR